VKPNGTLGYLAGAVCCEVVGYAALRLPPDALAAWRGQLTARTGGRLTPSFIKHTDEQTVAALAGVLQAMDDYGLHPDRMNLWGVLAAPRYLGRVALAQSMARFAAEGAWGLSPHMIPHRSLHSASGTISQALNFQGLNLGVGGGCNAASEALLLAGATLDAGRLAGLWVTMTGYDPEVVPTESGREARPCDCCVVALALTAAKSDSAGRRLYVKAAAAPRAPEGRPEGGPSPLLVESLLAALTAEPGRAVTTFPLGAGGWLQLDGTRARTGSVC
jgi:hypothetical protein